jgi:hypothetical protein
VGHWNRMRMGGSKSFLSLFVAFSMVFSLLSVALSEPIQAKSTRAAIVVNVKGTVTVKKSGGSKSYTAYGDMTLNQGDVISTGAASSVVVRIADHDDEITIGDNAEVSVTDLESEGNGKQSKVSSWAGSLWVKVKSLVGSEDEFEVETPTAVMAVRGTQFFTGVDPQTGETFVMVGAGAVLTTTTVYNQPDTNNPQEGKTTLLLPTQQINLTGRKEVNDLNTKVEIVDIFKLVEQSSPELLEAIIKNKAEIDAENKQFLDNKKAEIAENNKANTGNSALTINDIETLNKISKNLDNIIGNIAKQALEQKKIDPERMNQIISEANAKISEIEKKIDLSKVEPLDPTAGIDALKEKEKQAELLKLNEQKALMLEEQNKLEQAKLEKYKAILETLEKDKQRIQEANKKTEEAAKKLAEEEYIKTLSAAEKTTFEQSKNNANTAPTTSTTPTTSTGSGTGTGGSSSGGSSSSDVTPPPSPVLVSPTQETTNTTGTVQVKLTAVATANIQIMNGDAVLATLPGKGTEEVLFNLTLPNGVYNLTARTARAERFSALVPISKITVNTAPVVTPVVTDVLLTQVNGVTNNTVNLNLSLKNFLDAKQFYAVEAHLVYSNTLSYSGAATLTDVPGTVFDGANMAETLKQHTGSTQNELVYAASQFETSTTAGTISNLSVNGEKLLVTIPLVNVNGTAPSPTTVELVYVKVVDKSGTVVYELGSNLTNTPKSLSVVTK